MHESVRSLRWSWIGFGWFLAVALTSLVILALVAFGLLESTDSPRAGFWLALALAIGFFATGVYVGTRVVAAPILHGTAIGLFSLAVWVGLNLFVGEPVGETTWRSLDAQTLALLLLIQGVASIVGVRLGVRWMRRPPTTPV